MSTEDTQTPPPPSITMRRNGPLFIQGDITLVDPDGNVVEPPKRPYSLCRCGQSMRRPFCDGSHKTNGYCDTAAENVPAPE